MWVRGTEVCGTCKHHKTNEADEWICTNEDSEYYGLETQYGEKCLDYEER